MITRRLSRSGHSEYLLNKAPVRLRDIQDLLRGTGLGSDAGVVIEAKMIDLLLSDRADERRSLFEEAAGIGLYRDRKHSTERRLEETHQDLQRVEDLDRRGAVAAAEPGAAEGQGRAARQAHRGEVRAAAHAGAAAARAPVERRRQHDAALRRAGAGAPGAAPGARRSRSSAGRRRAAPVTPPRRSAPKSPRRLASVRVELGRLEGDLAVAAERLGQRRSAPAPGQRGARPDGSARRPGGRGA